MCLINAGQKVCQFYSDQSLHKKYMYNVYHKYLMNILHIFSFDLLFLKNISYKSRRANTILPKYGIHPDHNQLSLNKTVLIYLSGVCH